MLGLCASFLVFWCFGLFFRCVCVLVSVCAVCWWSCVCLWFVCFVSCGVWCIAGLCAGSTSVLVGAVSIFGGCPCVVGRITGVVL